VSLAIVLQSGADRAVANDDELQRAMQALRDSEARFRSLTELSSDWYWEQDAELRFVHTAGAGEDRSGITPAQHVGLRRWELPRTSTPTGDWSEHRAVLAARLPFRDFLVQRHEEDGGIRYVSVSGEPVFGADGAFRGYRGVAKDVTDIQRGLRALRETERRLSTLIASLPGAAYRCRNDARWTSEFFSEGVRALTGYGPQAFVAGKVAFADLIHREDRERVAQAVQEALARRQPYTLEYRIRTADGEDKWFWERGAGVLGAAGEVLALEGFISDITERKLAEERLAHLAQFDALTGLPNRTLVQDRLAQTIAQARRQARQVAVLFVDLDRFKLVNDTLGHFVGDLLIAEVARRLLACVRPGDTVGRISGDEFAVVLADLAHADDAALVAQKMLDALARAYQLAGSETFISASIGIAVYPGDGADAQDLLRNADMAMYRAKESTRNAYCFFTPEMNQRASARMQLNNDLRHAIERREFVLHYQPKVDLVSGRMQGMEALLRWNHPTRGLVAPLEFVPALEESGLILPVGEWVLEEACAQIGRWRAEGLAPVPVAINLSAKQFRRRDLDAVISRALAAAGVPSTLLELEITESCLMEDPEQAVRLLDSLRRAGVRISVDDFGTGYSSLSYLTRLPLSALKIDRSFVRDAVSSPQAASIVRAVIDMAHNLRFTVIAEGVETEQQVAFLRQHACDQAQGFLYGRPGPAEQMRGRLAPAMRA
jgi:diguanylate cyclase (GGDEF)-like protein/PAS domain S-box-containing protein